MGKVKILERCASCNGEAYVFQGVDENANGEPYDKYRPCEACQGTGKATRWISLKEFSMMLDRAMAFEPDYETVDKKPVTAYQDSRDAAELPG